MALRIFMAVTGYRGHGTGESVLDSVVGYSGVVIWVRGFFDGVAKDVNLLASPLVVAIRIGRRDE